MATEKIALTKYASGGGCGCKISPATLEKILKTSKNLFTEDENLLVGNNTKDDAAVYKIDNTTAIISTTDFFMPIVDDAYTFGQIAATNAISDVYAMGGEPIMALAILGFPLEKLPLAIASKIIDGARKVCKDAGISLAGGHSIDTPEPIFGLAVNGRAKISNIKQNSGAKAGDKLFLTKPIGVGILANAIKREIIEPKDYNLAKSIMLKLNKIGAEIGKLKYVNAMTDVTGFGVLGHLVEVCEGSDLSAELYFDNIVTPKCLAGYIEKGCIPGGTIRNFDSYGKKISNITEDNKKILCDPQTSGGLLVSVSAKSEANFIAFLEENGLKAHTKPIGEMKERNKKEKAYVYIV